MVNDRRQGIFTAATVSGTSELVSVEVSGKLVLMISAWSVQDEKSFFCGHALGLLKPAMSNPNGLLSQKLSHYLHQGHTLNDLLDLSKLI